MVDIVMHYVYNSMHHNTTYIMSMHLHHPSLSLSGKKKGKKKFRSAEEARTARELEASWAKINQKWASSSTKSTAKRTAETLQYKLSAPVGRASTVHIPSKNTGEVAATVRKPMQYTGEECIGIGQMHKSNSVPIFRKSDAEDIAKMRR